MGVNGINGMGGVAPARTAPARRSGAGGFRVDTAATAGPTGTMAVTMPSLLGLQEAQGDAVSDREARRHADEVLDMLRELQHGLLGGGGKAGELERLGRLARQAPQAADPALSGVQRALLVRVAVEAARAKAAASS